MAAYLKKPFSHNPLIARKPLIRVTQDFVADRSGRYSDVTELGTRLHCSSRRKRSAVTSSPSLLSCTLVLTTLRAPLLSAEQRTVTSTGTGYVPCRLRKRCRLIVYSPGGTPRLNWFSYRSGVGSLVPRSSRSRFMIKPPLLEYPTGTSPGACTHRSTSVRQLSGHWASTITLPGGLSAPAV